MRNFTSFCISSLLLASLAPMSSEAAKSGTYFQNVISKNSALQSTLVEMGFTPQEAAKRFEEAETAAEKANLDLDLGTLAICGKARGGLVLGAGRAICSTLFNAYSVKTTSISIGGQMMAGLGAVYFRTVNRKNKKFCYLGGGFSAGYILYVDGGAMAEVPCGEEEDKMGWNRGLLVHVAVGGGAGADVSGDATTVTHLANYWGIF